LFVVEQPGVIRVVHNGDLRPGSYLDIRSRVNSSGSEQGLLSVAFDPSFSSHPRLWVAYTRGDGALVIARFRAASAGARHVAASTGRTVLVVPHPVNTNHNGGQLWFGPDGMLYVGTGDGGSGGDPPNNAQNRNVLLGKMLRIDVRHSCGKLHYCVPRTNPFAGKTPGRGEIWLWGLRNPWRWSFDPATGAMWIGDVGQDAVEEIDRVPAKPSIRNLGWSCWEGRQHYNTSRCRNGARYRFPVATVDHPKAEAILGGFVYRGSKYRTLMNGVYIFGDDVTGKVWTYRKGEGKHLQTARLPGNPSGFGIDDRGEIWAVTLDGRLWSMRATTK
jgi:glucose/arabinose dehydrogenase